ncbi:MAG: 3-oxoacyl-ACP synthase, partial [Polyangiaceae bacterium]|nr:3-oxoacyl-ACP synthase [Polyangiaceae bacterium]
MSDACAIAAGAVSALGLGRDAYRAPAPGDPPRVGIAPDSALAGAGLLRPFAARAPADLGVVASADRAADLLSAALAQVISGLAAVRPG